MKCSVSKKILNFLVLKIVHLKNKFQCVDKGKTESEELDEGLVQLLSHPQQRSPGSNPSLGLPSNHLLMCVLGSSQNGSNAWVYTPGWHTQMEFHAFGFGLLHPWLLTSIWEMN